MQFNFLIFIIIIINMILGFRCFDKKDISRSNEPQIKVESKDTITENLIVKGEYKKIKHTAQSKDIVDNEYVNVRTYDKYIQAQDVKTINEFKDKIGIFDTDLDVEDLNGVLVACIYDKSNNNFLGFVGDTSKFDYRKLKYYKKDKRFKYLMNTYPKDQAEKLYQEKVWIGMSKDEASESWGEPKSVNTTSIENLTIDQWIYDNNQYLNFENGKLKSIKI